MTTLKQRLDAGPVLAPGVFDALSALLAAEAGFQAIYLSGAAIAYTQLGRPDIGLVSATQVADVVARVRDRVSLPLIVDIDTGFGNAINVKQTVRQFERLGASALQIEDQTTPKRCGHLQGKELISGEEMAGKVRAAVDARQSAETLIIARTDAIGVEGLGRALERAALYREAGADILFLEAPQTLEDMTRIGAAFGAGVHLVANMVEGGRTPLRSLSQLSDLGFRLVITPGALVRAFAFMGRAFFRQLRDSGSTTGSLDRMLDFGQINALLGLPEMLEEGRGYASWRKDAAE
ncbi:MAG: carboxyvinyl-carboxyphosphonate phosphorylmutase [Alphaproteobacteria bacterium]|nr:carboxyvinyl-carboxyphosphonate phosphorylmutase [Alphaproteobacteria bacterium]